jgi:hypothetical protein
MTREIYSFADVGVLQRSKSFHKVVHNISLGLTLTQTSGDNSKGSVACPLLHQLLLIQCGASLHGGERRAARLKPRRDPAQRLALPALLLVFPHAEVGLTADGVRRDHCTALRLYGEDVGLECEGVDELGVWEWGAIGQMCLAVCKWAPGWSGGRDDVGRLTYAFTLSGRGWMSGGSSTWKDDISARERG